MIRRQPRSTQSRSSAASDVYKRQHQYGCNAQETGLHGRMFPRRPLSVVMVSDNNGLDALCLVRSLYIGYPVSYAGQLAFYEISLFIEGIDRADKGVIGNIIQMATVT